LDIERFKKEEFKFVWARGEFLWIVEVNIAVWVGLEVP